MFDGIIYYNVEESKAKRETKIKIAKLKEEIHKLEDVWCVLDDMIDDPNNNKRDIISMFLLDVAVDSMIDGLYRQIRKLRETL